MSSGGRRPRTRGRGIAFATSAGLAALLATLFVGFLVKLASSGSVKNQLGESTFVAGRTRDYAPQVDRNGPLLFNDLRGGTRQVFLQHLGGDRKLGWVAIQARVDGEAKRCVLQWHQDDHLFHDPCSPTTYPADGAGLVRYPVTVRPSDRLDIDLRTPLPTDTTITTGPALPNG
ncbi:MAG: hypothetical protein NVS3B21_28660 [Acidimicrobiales bacterium]